MKNITRFFILVATVAPLASANAAVKINKAAPVETKSSTDMSGNTASLAGTALGLVVGVMDINKQQKSLTAECIPSKRERDFVDNMMKEWAKSGKSKEAVQTELNREPCSTDNGECYSSDVQYSEASGASSVKNNVFKGPGNDKMIWDGFPRVGFAEYTDSNNKKVTKSDAYDLFALIDFEPADYNPDELTMAGNLLKKVENCSTTKLNAKKKALWGTFLLNTAGGVGKKTNSGDIMQQVGGIMGSTGGSIGGTATQVLLMNAMKNQ